MWLVGIPFIFQRPLTDPLHSPNNCARRLWNSLAGSRLLVHPNTMQEPILQSVDEFLIEILWQLFFFKIYIYLRFKWLNQMTKFAHVMTAELSWHVQNLSPDLKTIFMKRQFFFQGLVNELKIVCETGPRFSTAEGWNIGKWDRLD